MNKNSIYLIDKLEENKELSKEEILFLLDELKGFAEETKALEFGEYFLNQEFRLKDFISKTKLDNNYNKEHDRKYNISFLDKPSLNTFIYLQKKARRVTDKYYGKDIYIRGLIEFTNHCEENCYYCGIRKGNENIPRFRLSKKQILDSCKLGYNLGFRTFVLQGGEDSYYQEKILVDIIKDIKSNFPDCALTLSIGVRSFDSYKAFKNAGADRFLLRHETALESHFDFLHPKNQSLKKRQKALFDLKELGFTVGSGIMVGSPNQSNIVVAKDLEFLKKLEPEMIGIGPFIPHKDSPFKNYKAGNVLFTLALISILRLSFPNALIPATTALNTASPMGRILGFCFGANVVMPNLSPDIAKTNYNLYDNKKIDGLESAASMKKLKEILLNYGFKIKISRGDPLK